MQDAYPALAIILIVHLKKPQGRGERRISDVLGEWGRWCDVLVLQENDGSSLTKTKLSVRKRVRHERRIVATKRDGLLVDAQDVEPTGPKVSMDAVVAAIQASPGLTFGKLAKTLNVAPSTAAGYVATAAEQGLVDTLPGPRRSTLVYPTVHPPVVSDERAGESLDGRGGATVHRPPTYIGGQSSTGDSDLVAEARRIFGDVEVSA
jgi:DNA-binding MarR family transcriptional regulator